MKKLLFFLSYIFFLTAAFAQEAVQSEESADSIVALPWPQNIQAKLDSVVANDEMLQTSQLGMMVYDLTADSSLYTFNHRQTMRPASTMKVVTAVAALDRLGGNYQFSTTLAYSGEINGRTLYGNIYLGGGMDPLFNSEDMREFAVCVHNLGIDTICGAIMTDCSMKDAVKWGEGWCWDDDNPELTPLLVDRKPFFVESFISELSMLEIVVDSVKLYEEPAPQDAIPLMTCRHHIDQLLLRMMKDSDNLYAECLFYNLAASLGRRYATARHARLLENSLINSLGLNSDKYKLSDGSGLSLYNYVSPELLSRLLQYAWRSPRIKSHLLPSLPIAGVDGTLKKRMKNTPAEGNVRAKTGTLSGVITLAGYATATNGHDLCFVLMNQGVLSAREARSFQDRVCTILCEE